MTECLVVGRGLAASVLMHTLHQRGVSFAVIGSPELSSSSKVAAGIWNPVVFKRLSTSWMAAELIPFLLDFYPACEQAMHTKLITLRQIIKPFGEPAERTRWIAKANGELEPYLRKAPSDDLSTVQGLIVRHGYGIVESAGNLDVSSFLDHTARFFKDRVYTEQFVHGELRIQSDHIMYRAHRARHIIFCEGYLIRHNPYFNWVPMKPVKGEVITVRSEGIQLRQGIFNRDGFLMDLSDEQFKVGATYNWDQLDDVPSVPGRQILEAKLRRMTEASFEVVGHQAGVRPASIDRRPIVGTHPAHDLLHVFNGLGSKGVMLAPYFASKFVDFLFKKEHLCPEADLKRYYHLYEGAPKAQDPSDRPS